MKQIFPTTGSALSMAVVSSFSGGAMAAEGGYAPVVKALLARGADAHAVDAEDRTPLSRAAARGHTEIVDLINVGE